MILRCVTFCRWGFPASPPPNRPIIRRLSHAQASASRWSPAVSWRFGHLLSPIISEDIEESIRGSIAPSTCDPISSFRPECPPISYERSRVVTFWMRQPDHWLHRSESIAQLAFVFIHSTIMLSRSLTMSIRPPARLRRETSPEREKSQAQQVIAKVLDDIKAAIKRPEKMQKAYVCYADLRRIWSDKSKIATLIQSSSPSDEQIDYIQTHMIIILSTLVYIGAVDCLAAFTSRFFRHISSHSALYEDSDIPYFEKSKLKFLDPEPASQQQFYENQFMFKPVIIEIKKNQTTQTVDPKQRLPFESLVKDVGAGGYGKVDRVGISPRYIKQPDGWDSREVKTPIIRAVRLWRGIGLYSCMQKGHYCKGLRHREGESPNPEGKSDEPCQNNAASDNDRAWSQPLHSPALRSLWWPWSISALRYRTRPRGRAEVRFQPNFQSHRRF